MHRWISTVGPHRFNVYSAMPHLMRLVLLRRTFSAVAILPQSSTAFQPCRRIIVLEGLWIPWFTYKIRLKVQNNAAIFGNNSTPTAQSRPVVTTSIAENRLVRSTILRYYFRAGLSNPVTLVLLPYKSSAESSSWRVIPNIHTYRLELVLESLTIMRFIVLASIASAALVAAAPAPVR